MTTPVPGSTGGPVTDRESKTSGWEAHADLVVLGSGVAGLTAALRARELGLRVLVVTKAAVADGNTRWAQGGVAVVLDGDPGDSGASGEPSRGDRCAGRDSVFAHARDTVEAGAGLCDVDAVREIVGAGPAAVSRLRERGARFDTTDGTRGAALARTREGGHSAFRVIHAGGDATGAEVQRSLVATATERSLAVLERHIAVDALRTPDGAVAGVTVLDPHGIPGVVRAPAVLVATGGFGQLYHATSNPDIATGDGLALAMRAGAGAADIEFVQFHPTVLHVPGASGRCPLVTEAVRGEGAVLVDAAGAAVMRGVHPAGDLAPRDVVSAAITARMAQAPGGVDDHVFLDATGIAGFARRFPTVHTACVAAGVDPAREPIPVTPAAHFACGGVVTDTQGRTDVPGLYAAGEVARTGLHGANRLASNSLLEGLVLGQRAAESVAADVAAGRLADPAHGREPGTRVVPIADRAALQRLMSRYAAIGRDAEGLAVAGSVLDLSVTDSPLWTPQAVEDAALTLIARALLVAAARRDETRGCHVRTDAPERDPAWRRSQLVRLNPSGQPVLADPILEGAA